MSWNTTAGSSDTEDLPGLDKLRQRSRDHYRNTPLITGAINTKAYNVIGAGLQLQSTINNDYLGISDKEAAQWQKNTEFEFRLWAEEKTADIEQTKTFYEMQSVAFVSSMISGDVFALTPYVKRKNNPYSLAIMLIEADRCSTPNAKELEKNVHTGIKVDDNGAPVSYYFSKKHPADDYEFKWTEVPALGKSGRKNVIHLYSQVRPHQKRGVPLLAPVIENLKQLQDYTNAELTAALVSGLFTVFVKTQSGEIPDPLADSSLSLDNDEYSLGAGAIVGLAEGEEITTANPNRPNTAFDGFTTSIIKQIAAGLDMPYELLMKHFSASYSASRGALLEAWKAFKTRRTWFANNFCKPIYEEFLIEAVLLGRINAPGFLEDPAIKKAYCGAVWVGPTQGQLDPTKETNAAELRVRSGFSTRTKEAAEMNGSDFDMNIKKAKDESAKMIESGLAKIEIEGEPI